MSKYNVSFNVDLSHIAPELLGEGGTVTASVEDVITSMLLSSARAHAKDELHRIRTDAVMDADVKAIKMAEQMRKMMLTLMAQANLEVTQLTDDTTIETELPFERRYAAAA